MKASAVTNGKDVPWDDWIRALSLVHEYAHLSDTGQLDVLERVFTEDATFESNVPLFPVQTGRAAIIAALSNTEEHLSNVRRKHCVSNFRIMDYDGTHIRSSAYLLQVHTQPGAPPMLRQVGMYDDHMVKGPDGRWRFSSRMFVTDLATTRRAG